MRSIKAVCYFERKLVNASSLSGQHDGSPFCSLRLTGKQELGHCRMAVFSGSMQRRLAVAVACIHVHASGQQLHGMAWQRGSRMGRILHALVNCCDITQVHAVLTSSATARLSAAAALTSKAPSCSLCTLSSALPNAVASSWSTNFARASSSACLLGGDMVDRGVCLGDCDCNQCCAYTDNPDLNWCERNVGMRSKE